MAERDEREEASDDGTAVSLSTPQLLMVILLKDVFALTGILCDLPELFYSLLDGDLGLVALVQLLVS